jgi:checkpoint serine/threonine-protein kinase
MRPLDVVEPSKPLDVVEPSEIAAASLRRVFSRPGENSFVPKRGASFTPFVDTATEPPPSGSKPRFALADRTPSKPLLSDDDADDDDAGDDEAEEEEAMHEYDYQEAPPQESTDEDDYHEAAEHELEQYRVPLGGRFGQFNVMTPITERTYEFTTSTRAAMTPNDDSSPFLRHEHDALLTAELREEEEREQALSLARVSFDPERRRHSCQSEGREALDSSFTSEGGEGPLPALPIVHGDDETGVLDPSLGVAALEQRTATLSLEDALAVKLAFKPPNPCNPFDPPIVTTLLSVMPSERGFHDLRDREAKLLDGLNKFADKRRKLSGNGTANLTLDLAQSCSVTLGDRRFAVLDKLGEGGFGSVFAAKERSRVRDLGGSDDDEDDEDEDDEGTSSMIALKVVRPRNVWEYHVLRRLHAALPPHLRKSVVVPHALYAFRDESFLILDFCSQGTLLNVVNHASQAGVSQQGACLDEMLVIFFTVELLRLLEGMHSVGFVHGDLKIDNCLLRLEDVPGGSAAWANVYQPSGVGGWSRKGIKLIDFGRTIDTALFPRGQTFVAEWAVDARDCPEMREDRPWTYQPDYFGLAGVVYCMLFGKYIEAASVTRQSDGRLRLSTPFKRYWQSDMWTRLFDLLLNPCLVRAGGELPLCRELRELREGMEGWLESNSNRTGNTLKALLKKVERSVL